MSKRKSVPNIMDQLQGLPPPNSTQRPQPARAPIQQQEQPITAEVADRVASAPRQSNRKKAASSTRRRRSAAKKTTSKERLAGRATYDIGKELKEAIVDESIQLGVPASQLARYLLLEAWDMYEREEIPEPELIASDSPKFRNLIDFSNQ
ncbi:MAG: hypothetical protein AAF490_16960 [Chloroflexota bacterium]